MVALPAWRLAHAALRSLGWGRAMAPLALVLHFACWGSNCRWPFLRHPHELESSVVAHGYFGGSATLRAVAGMLPQNDVSVIAPYFLYYGALPAVLPRYFPAVLPTFGMRGLRRGVRAHPGLSRAVWIGALVVLLTLCALAASAGTPLSKRAVYAGDAASATGTDGGRDAESERHKGASSAPPALQSSSRAAHGWLPLRALLDAALYHSKRAYGCTATVFPPRPLVVRTDAAQPCGAGSAGGWSLGRLMLDLSGVAFSSLCIVALAAVAPRTATSWTHTGANTLAVYLTHLYVLPAIDMPLAALAQAAAYFVHPEAAALATLAGCLLLVRALAIPLPSLPVSAGRRAAEGIRRAVLAGGRASTAGARSVLPSGRSEERKPLVAEQW